MVPKIDPKVLELFFLAAEEGDVARWNKERPEWVDFDNMIDLGRRKLDHVDLSEVDMAESDLMDCSLRGAKFINSNLRSVRFCDSDLSYADFTGATLSGADFIDCDLTGASVTAEQLAVACLYGVKGLSEDMQWEIMKILMKSWKKL